MVHTTEMAGHVPGDQEMPGGRGVEVVPQGWEAPASGKGINNRDAGIGLAGGADNG